MRLFAEDKWINGVITSPCLQVILATGISSSTASPVDDTTPVNLIDFHMAFSFNELFEMIA
jgi:hypothetical protein